MVRSSAFYRRCCLRNEEREKEIGRRGGEEKGKERNFGEAFPFKSSFAFCGKFLENLGRLFDKEMAAFVWFPSIPGTAGSTHQWR